MEKHHHEITISPDKWPELLTPELRAHFDRVGEELVMRDVSNHRYTAPEKHFAAVFWLGEQRRAREKRHEATHQLVKWALIIALLSLLVTIADVAAFVS